jgi:hypothetical protein
MKRFTVVWGRDAEAELARLWNNNPAVRAEISEAADEIDRALAIAPEHLGIAGSARSRQVVVIPLRVLYSVSPDDRRVNVLYVKFWDD